MRADATQVVPGGYAWWYFDGISADEKRAFSAIFLIGSVFSPRYARRLRGGPVPAEDHVAVNLALYEGGQQRAWVMSEYGASGLRVGPDGLSIGNSRIERLADGGVRLHFEEHSAPLFASAARIGTRIVGEIELHPEEAPLDESPLPTALGAIHRWRVPMPRARVRARFARPEWGFEGIGYHDVNRGDGRLEDSFSRWSWARFHGPERTVVLYSVLGRGGDRGTLVADASSVTRHAALAEGPPHGVGWGLRLPAWFAPGTGPGAQGLRCTPDAPLDVAPFYARYLATLSDGDQRVARGMGEYLDLDRFRRREIQFLLHFKTRRCA